MKVGYVFSLITSLILIENVHATVYEYKQVSRTYVDLSSISTSECGKNFRFINSNWMDCTFQLPNPGVDSPIKQIVPAIYQIENFTLKTPIYPYQYYIDLRDTGGSSYDEASMETQMAVSGYYRLPGNLDIQQLNERNYSFPIFENYLRTALKNISDKKTLSSRTIIAVDPSQPNAVTNDQVIGPVYVGEQNLKLDLNLCEKNYEVYEYDQWPYGNNGVVSRCNVRAAPQRSSIPLESHWSEQLKLLNGNPVIVLGFPDGSINGLIPVVRVLAGEGSYEAMMGLKKDSKSEPNYDVAITYQEAEKYLKLAFDQINNVKTHFILFESGRATLEPSERILGKLVLNHSHGTDDVIDLR